VSLFLFFYSIRYVQMIHFWQDLALLLTAGSH
jgi:hypothetical protein